MKNNKKNQKNIQEKTFFSTLRKMALSSNEKSHIRQRIFDTIASTTTEVGSEIAPVLPKLQPDLLLQNNDRRGSVRINRDRRQSVRKHKDRRQFVRIHRDRRHYYRGLLAITSFKRLYTYNLRISRNIQRLKTR